MPVINDKYYANPQYGSAFERARIADEEFRGVHGEPEPSWLDRFLGFADTADTKQTKLAQQGQSQERHTD